LDATSSNTTTYPTVHVNDHLKKIISIIFVLF
jgi:hypothetical protein